MNDSTSPRTSHPLWDRHRESRRQPASNRRHRTVHHRHGFVFGFPNCTATELDEYLDDAGPAGY